jgi:hypothetical protein
MNDVVHGSWPEGGERMFIQCDKCGRTKTIVPAASPGGVTTAEAVSFGWARTEIGWRCSFCLAGPRGAEPRRAEFKEYLRDVLSQRAYELESATLGRSGSGAFWRVFVKTYPAQLHKIDVLVGESADPYSTETAQRIAQEVQEKLNPPNVG